MASERSKALAAKLARRHWRVRAPALPAQPVPGGRFGRGAKPPSSLLAVREADAAVRAALQLRGRRRGGCVNELDLDEAHVGRGTGEVEQGGSAEREAPVDAVNGERLGDRDD